MSIAEKYRRMPPLPGDLRERLEGLSGILQRHPVRLAYLFGSTLEMPEQSRDVDLAVLPDEGFSYTELYAELSLALRTDRLEVIDLRFAPLYLAAEVLLKGRCLFARSETERARFESGKLSQWLENRTRWLQRLMSGEESMSLNPEFLGQALSQLERVVQELRKYREVSEEQLATNLSLRWTVERGLLAGLTLVFQIAEHILTRAFGRSPDSYEELLAELCAVGVISEDLYRRLRGSGGFRNVLVHEYVSVDLQRVAEAVRSAPEVFETFEKEVRQWIRKQASA
jgi:uncharacterized protein YutE (UPF0331/DUF86 family)